MINSATGATTALCDDDEGAASAMVTDGCDSGSGGVDDANGGDCCCCAFAASLRANFLDENKQLLWRRGIGYLSHGRDREQCSVPFDDHKIPKTRGV